MTTRNAFPSNFALAVTAPTKEEEVMGREIGLSLSSLFGREKSLRVFWRAVEGGGCVIRPSVRCPTARQ